MIVETTKELTDKHGNVLKPRKRGRTELNGPADVAFVELRYWAAHWREIADPEAREAKHQWLQAENAKRAEADARRAFHNRFGCAYQFPPDAAKAVLIPEPGK